MIQHLNGAGKKSTTTTLNTTKLKGKEYWEKGEGTTHPRELLNEEQQRHQSKAPMESAASQLPKKPARRSATTWRRKVGPEQLGPVVDNIQRLKERSHKVQV